MVRQETIKRILDYVSNTSDLDQELVHDGLYLFYLQREIELLIENYDVKRFGISRSQIDTLEILFHAQDEIITPAQLAEDVHLTRSAMTSNLDSLERKEYISREAHPSDRRMVAISLTLKGIEFCEEIMPIRYRETCKVVKSMSKEERETIKGVYSQILKGLRELKAEAGD